ncbi:hypothetical protein P2H44_07920 [Albimonas sp. CAU 1670]|uniref:darcynin family protein n=1 Tax=Albimonas sp. CAU 1670 TaxID=3032599 RepID=UPI0023D9A9F4|nr:darcynin family protein [Albimonas sp. CAU 1670]MDF2232477.1 hypothetical protein [Albimonas sp. CAU 1670]
MTSPAPAPSSPPMTVFLLLRARPSWLALDRAARDALAGPAIAEAFGARGLRLRHFDAEAFHGRVSDIAMVEVDAPLTWHGAMERLRDSPLLAQDHFEVVDILPAIEDGFRLYEAGLAGAAAPA